MMVKVPHASDEPSDAKAAVPSKMHARAMSVTRVEMSECVGCGLCKPDGASELGVSLVCKRHYSTRVRLDAMRHDA